MRIRIIEKIRHNQRKKIFALATFLDPKYKFGVFDEEGKNEIKSDVLGACQRINQKYSEDRTELNDETPIVIGDEINLESDEEAPIVEYVISKKPSPNLWKCLEDIKSASGSDNTGMNEDSVLSTSVSQEIEAYIKIFSEFGNIYDPNRSRLLPQNGEKIVFLHHNLRKLNFKY
ncbi:hypothetical protein HHI36_012191 [Cryptolaemus montrouzieri]|uniref:Uncharacterized protein n=1 Tax=Cryptolaemus montrouzieri TaxID=559131 RepID=A0ABD2NEI8_9CUCU